MPNYQPLFTNGPLQKGFLVSTANTNRDGTGSIVTIATPGDNGARIDAIIAKAIVSTTAGMLRWYVLNLGTWRLIGETNVDAVTVSASVQGWQGLWTPPGGFITLAAGQLVGASTHNAESFCVHVEGGQY